MKVLLVDNDPVYLSLLTEVLTLHNHEVVQASDGEEALKQLVVGPVDVIISDISMPRMNGIALHKHVRTDPVHREVPFVWNTGYPELREVTEIEDYRIDFKMDKKATLPNLLYFLNHLKANVLEMNTLN